ncbi:unnamed protein product [Cuscuta europaea]|uniref:Uncharacterized protein n=1 Tax=Cuscuta europaea TaxID=41803 RepID=A0A9P0YRB3_CUSEU|nr:unnamed protein product [Cuscuta europaea]
MQSQILPLSFWEISLRLSHIEFGEVCVALNHSFFILTDGSSDQGWPESTENKRRKGESELVCKSYSIKFRVRSIKHFFPQIGREQPRVKADWRENLQ